MATAPDDLTPQQKQRRQAYEASYRASRKRAKDPEFVAMLRERIKEMDANPKPPLLTREEFLAQTESADE